MIYIRKNIWELFAVIMVIGLILLSYVLYTLWGTIHQKYELEQENIARISAHATSDILSQHESTLGLLGEFLMKNNTYKDKKKSKAIFNNILKSNSSILAFGLVDLKGNLYVTSIDKDVNELPNLMKKNETKESFNQALNSDSMILGRTYFHKTLNSYIIPIRKIIRDKNLDAIAVITAGIRLDDWYIVPHTDKNKTTKYESFLLRDLDYYFQVAPRNNKIMEQYYEKCIPKEYGDSVKQSIANKNATTIKAIKDNNMVVSAKYTHYVTGKEVFSSLSYIKKYQLWRVVQIPSKVIHNEFLKKMAWITSFFVLTGIILFYLFYQLSKVAKKNRLKLEHQAEHDYLTELQNRYYLSKKFKNIDVEKPFSLIVLDIDNFKNINKNYGHDYGDLTLKEIANRLEQIKKQSDILVRYSGNEFLFIRYAIDKQTTRELAKEIINILYEPHCLDEQCFILGTSIGISSFPNDGKDFESIKKCADIALQEAKKDKNSYRFFEEKIKQKYLRYSQIEQELKTALQKNELHMVYQPQIKSDGTLYGVEALVRWESKTLGHVSPEEFISIAEQSGMMVKLGQFINKTSLKEINEIQKAANKRFQLSINISVKQFVDLDCCTNLLRLIEKTGFDKSLLTLEVTENLFIEDIEFVLAILEGIRKENIKISLDDFGTGYSSLSLLKKLPIDELKIDKSFIDDIQTDQDAQNMVKGVILIGKQLKMTLLAEGVEKEEQKDMLNSYGCDLFQGYYFSKPLKKEALLEYFKVLSEN